MPSYNKSFNFRNGVQVDEDNFVVNANGLVGIGTSIPREFLDVYGTAKITGLVTATNLTITGDSTFNSDVKIGSGIAFNSSTGIVSATKFVGDATGLTNIYAIAIDGWYINAGSISTISKVGIGTTLPSSQLDVVGDATVSGIVTASAFGGYQVLVGTESSATKIFKVTVASKTSNHRYFETGSTNAYFIDGKESPFLTLLPGKTYRFDQSDASNTGNRLGFYLKADGTTPYNTNVTTTDEVPGTSGSYTQITVTDTTPVVLHYQSSSSAYMGNAIQFNSNIVNTPYQITTLAGISATTGIVTAYSFSGFGTDIQGINATNITNGTLNNSRLPQSINITGIITASSGVITSLTNTNLNNTGFATLGITSISNLTVGSAVTITSSGIFAPTGIITASRFVGGLVGIASTARDLTYEAELNITRIESVSSSIGISTVTERLYAESIGVGTNSPSSDIHIRRSSVSSLQVTSDTAEAIIAVGRSTTLTGSNGALIYGNTSGLYPYSDSKTLDVVNYDTGNLNHYLHYGLTGVGTGNFNWFHSLNGNNPLMSLTYGGNLGIGVTNPTNKLEVDGPASVSSLVSGNINATGNLSLNGSGNITASGDLVAIGSGTSTSVRVLYVYGGKSQILNSDGTEIFPESGVDENVYITSGISTFYSIYAGGTIQSPNGFFDENIITGTSIENSVLISSTGIGIGTNIILDFYKIDCLGTSDSPFGAGFGYVGIGTTTIEDEDTNLYVVGNSEFYGDMTVSGNITANNVNSLTLATAQNVSGLGTSVDFTGLPSWVKRVTVMFDGVSTNGSSNIQIQLGDSGGIETTNYASVSSATGGGTQIISTSVVTTGMVIKNETGAGAVNQGPITIVNINANTWTQSHTLADTGIFRSIVGAGTKTLSGTLDRVRITTVNGTDTFDQGTINIMYE